MKARREPHWASSTMSRAGFSRATRTSYQRIWWKHRAWRGGEAELGRWRSEFETGDFPRILSGFWFHPLLNRDHHNILLACFFMFLVYIVLTSEPLHMLFLLPGVPFPDLCSVPHHGHKSAPRKVFLDHIAEVAALYPWASLALFSFIFLYVYYILMMLVAFKNNLFICLLVDHPWAQMHKSISS